MRLHRLALRDVKGVAHREVIFPETGILVVEGPNEIGKSTMLEALDLVLEDKDSSRRARIRDARPIGRDVGPSVEVELSTGPYRFVYRKQWLRQTATELRILAPVREELVGDAAHERVLAMLAQTADLHLWKALRLLQSDPLVQGGLAGSSALAAALEAAAGTVGDGVDAGGDGVDAGGGVGHGAGRSAGRSAGQGAAQSAGRGPGGGGLAAARGVLAAAGASGAGAAGESLLSAAQAATLRYYTERTRVPTGEYRAAIERVEAATAAVQEAALAMEAVAEDVARHDSLAQALRDARPTLSRAGAERDRLALEQREVAELDRRLVQARADLAQARVRQEGGDERLAERAEHESALREQRQELAEAIAEQTRIGERWAAAREALAGGHDVLASARARADAARARVEAASARQARRRDEADVRALADRLAHVDRAGAALAAARAAMERDRVTAAVLRRIEAAAQAAESAAATCAAGSATVTLRALQEPRSVRIDDVEVPLAEEQPWTRPILQALRLEIDGVAVELAPEAGAGARAAQADAARRELEDLLAAVGCADTDAARQEHDRWLDDRSALAGAQARLEALLAGEDRARLQERLDTARARLAATPAHPGASDPPDQAPPTGVVATRGTDTDPGPAPDPDAGPARDPDLGLDVERGVEPGVDRDPEAVRETELDPAAERETESDPEAERETDSDLEAQVSAAQREAADAAEELDRARTRRQVLAEGVEAIQLDHVRVEGRVAALGAQVQDRHRRLEAARRARPDDALTQEREAARHAVGVAEHAVDEAQRGLQGRDAGDLAELLRAAEAEVGAHTARRRDLEQELIRVEARLEQAGGQGRAEAHDAARSELDHARRAHERIARRAQAARLLYDTLSARNLAAKRAYAAPFAAAVDRLGRIVYGPDFDVEVDDDLAITARTLHGQRVAYEALSTGAKEQLAILTRLACAQLVDPTDGVPVVIDDALGYSDPDRLRRVCAAVGRLGGHAQIVLLTCTPGRYAAIPAAQVVTL